MNVRVATAFNLCLFPQAFLYQRMFQSDVVIVLTDKTISQENLKHHANRTTLRTSMGVAPHCFRRVIVPVARYGLPVALTRARAKSEWRAQFLTDIRRVYLGLPYQKVVEDMVTEVIERVDSPWLTDYLMATLVATFDYFGWVDKQIVHGEITERNQHKDDSSHLFDLCMQTQCQQLILGSRTIEEMNQRLFARNEIALLPQHFPRNSKFSSSDSILDLLARYTPEEIMREFRVFSATRTAAMAR